MQNKIIFKIHRYNYKYLLTSRYSLKLTFLKADCEVKPSYQHIFLKVEIELMYVHFLDWKSGARKLYFTDF